MLVAFLAVERMTQHPVAPLLRRDPLANHPWWVMSNMLIVAAGELYHPMAFVISVKAADGLLHPSTSHKGTIGLVDSTSCLRVTAEKAACVAA